MRHDPLFLLWSINCPSEASCLGLQRLLAREITPNTLFEEEVRSAPDGRETVRREQHRLGDYFEKVQVFPASKPGAASFRLLFHRRTDAGRYWKDLMARVLQKMRAEAAPTTTTLEYRGDEIPADLEGSP